VMSDKPKRIDWESVLRDYRTGKFTLRELEAKHGVSYAQISRKAKAEGWTKDLKDVIRHATNVALLQETVTKAQKDTTDTVSVAVETNLRVIRGQHKRLEEMDGLYADAVRVAKAMLLAPADTKDSIAAVQATGTVFSTGKGLTELERKVFGLDDPEKSKADSFEELLNAITNG